MQAMNRRTFIGAAGATAVAAAMPTVVFAAEEESPAEAEEFDRPLSEDSERYCDRGGTTLTVEELNRIRHEHVDAAGEFVKEDGTVIPAVWNKLSVLTSSYGCGGLDPAYGEGIDFLMILFDYNEEDAQHYLDMPFGKEFTEVEYAQAANLPVQEAREICEDLAARGLLFRSRYNEGAMYHHMPYIHGFWEQSVPRMFDQDFIDVMAPSFMLGKHRLGQVQSGTRCTTPSPATRRSSRTTAYCRSTTGARSLIATRPLPYAPAAAA